MDPRLREDDEAAGIPGRPGRGAAGERFSQAVRSSQGCWCSCWRPKAPESGRQFCRRSQLACKLLALGVTTPRRSVAMDNVPTIAETGVSGYDLTPWFGVFMPAATPKEVVKAMNAALVEALRTPELKARLATLGAEPIGSTPEAFAAVLATEARLWEQLIRVRGIKAD